MIIQSASIENIPRLMDIFKIAKIHMNANGNFSQWVNGYPNEMLIRSEIKEGHCYILLDKKKIIATFCLIQGNDPTYDNIENGNWLNDKEYAVVHRMASDGSTKNVAAFILKWCFRRVHNLRIDTHANNLIMQHILYNSAFIKCGIIHLKDGSERIAFQKCIEVY